jgi:prepilin-type N-terminal cleavage/methylation domain-containing protein
MKIKNRPHLQGFTLIELLVVITIIAILAGIALPVFGTVQTKAAQTKALAQAKQLGLACKLFASDFSGNYPTNAMDATTGKPGTTAPGTSNVSLGCLIPDYVPDEKIFWVAQDKGYCNTNPPDNIAPVLGAGENHWAYVPNLTETSSSNFPLIADPTVSNGSSTYSIDETAVGGTWKAKKAIVIYVDGSGSIEVVNKAGGYTIPGPNANVANLFSTSSAGWLGASNAVLDPIPKAN